MAYKVRISSEEVKQLPETIRKTAKPNGRQWIIFGVYLKKWMRNSTFNQSETANWFGIPIRRLQQYLSINKPVWTGEAKRYVYESPEIFDFTTMDKITRRRWTNKRSLTNEVSRYLNGATTRKRWTPRSEKVDPNIVRFADELRSKYGTKVVLTDQSIELYHFGLPDHEQRLLEELLK